MKITQAHSEMHFGRFKLPNIGSLLIHDIYGDISQ